MNDDLITLSYRCTQEDADTIRELCKINGLTVSDLITQALLMYLDLAEPRLVPLTSSTYTRIFTTHG